ncbi:formyltransferase family protein [Nonomuraea sp. NBC_00507]|uniref:formyltransferase family protein n=1 Tax=Nonomuraea sp. NBC_00507 TaxID=2976002 RepID=UPI002E1950CF
MARIALFTTECAQLGDAITEIVERHHDELALVVTSDVHATRRGGLAKQTWTNLRRSGPAFVKYLTYSFLLYPLILRFVPNRSPVRELCARHGIRHIHTGNVNAPEVVAALREADLDFIVVYWFDQILREGVITAPKRAVINLHAAYLPHCRGLFPTLYSAIEPGTPFGITAHLIENREIDAGPVLAQRTTTPPPGRSVLFNDSWVNRAGVDLLDEVLGDFDRHLAEAVHQSGGSYYSYPERVHLAAARARGLRLSTLRDLATVIRGTRRERTADTALTQSCASADTPPVTIGGD